MRSAEMLIKIGEGAGYQDGDILIAFNVKRIRSVHAESICHPKFMGFTREGLRPTNSVAKDFYNTIYQYRFERISKTEINRIEIGTNTVDKFGWPTIDVDLFLSRRKKSKDHCIFGIQGREIWFGGNTNINNSKLDYIWSKISEKTGKFEDQDEFQLWPMGYFDIRHHLAIRTQDFSDQEMAGLSSNQYAIDADGNVILDSDGKPTIIARRNLTVDWRTNLLDDLQVTEEQVLDKNYPIGRDVVISRKKIRHESKIQPVQSDKRKIYNKALGGPLAQ